MRIREAAISLALAISWAAPAMAQQPPAPNPQFDAERQAAIADQMKAEKLFSTGERGPESEPCKLMSSYFLHLVKAAVAAGASTRVAQWSELNWQEQDAVKQKVTGVIWARSARMHQVACAARS